jgi:hypothetical protein
LQGTRILPGRERKDEFATKQDIFLCLVTNRVRSGKVIARPASLVDAGIEEHLNEPFDRTCRITISDDIVAESLPRSLPETAHDSSVEGLDLSCHCRPHEF